MAGHTRMQPHQWLAQGRSNAFGMTMVNDPPDECRDVWSTTLLQGEELWALLRAGSTTVVRGPGEHPEIRCPSPCWLH
eukprot:3671329-Prorocentrum_lima.AAC.1